MNVGITGPDPAAEAVVAALEDADARVSRIDLDAAADQDLVVAVGPAGSPTLDRVHRVVAGLWIAVELGGVGGRPVDGVEAAVSALDAGAGAGCFDCLRARVASNLDTLDESEGRTSRADARLAGAIAGRIAVEAVEGGSPAGRVIELPYTERRLLVVPGCGCDGRPGRRLGRDDDDLPIEAVVERAEAAVDGRIGPVRSVGEADSFPAPYYLAELCDTTAFSDAAAGPQAAGVADGWDAAFVKAIGEALERYAAGVYREAWFDDEPGPNRLDPAAFVTAGWEVDSEAPTRWIRGEALASGEAVSIPAEFVVFPPPAERYGPAITTGLGLGTSTVGALLSGLYEVVERDATMLAWYSTFEPLALDVDDPGFRTLAQRARAEGLETTALLVTQDVDVPVVAAAVHREGDWPRFAVGSGAHLDPGRAARSALAEAVQNWMELRGMGAERAAEEETAIGRHADFPREARSFLDIDTEIHTEDLGAGDAAPSTGVEALEAVLDRLATSDLAAYAARLTPRDVEALGFEAVRVLVPGAQPLFVGERFFGERARSVPREMGFRPRLDRPPHPYP